MTEPDAILLTSSFLPGKGGIETYLAKLCEHVAPRLAVLAPARRGDLSLPQDLPYPTHPLPRSGGMRAVPRAAEVAARSHDTRRVLFGTPWPLLLRAPRLVDFGLSYAVIVHGAELVLPGALPFIGARLARALSGADLVLPVSAYTREQARSLLERRHLRVPPMAVARAGIDLDRFHPGVSTEAARARLGIPDGRRLVLSVGRLVPRKGVGRLVGAMPRITRRVPDALLVVAGRGPEEAKLKRRAAATGAEVMWLGEVPDVDLPALYAMASVYALAVADRWGGLEAEGLGIVLLEAAACGTPVVTGRSGGTPEAVLDGETGFVVDAHNPDQLADALVSLLEDSPRAQEMGAKGRAHVERHFSGTPPQELLDWLDGKLGT